MTADSEPLTEGTTAEIMAQVLAELQHMRQELRRMREMLGLPQNGQVPQPTTEMDAYIMRTVADIYRRQQPKPVVTSTVALHLDYSQAHTRRLLKDCAARGLVYLVPGRGERISGKWLPMERAA